MSEIKLTAAQRDKRLSEVMAELQRLDGYDEWTGSQRARFHTLDAEAQSLIDQGRRDELAAFRNGSAGYTAEDGAASGPTSERYGNGPEVMRRVGDPWAADGVAHAFSSPGRARDYARAAVERSNATDAGKHRIIGAIDDPHAGVDVTVLSRWARVTSDPAYMRAFGKMLRDGDTGHREWTEDERRAVANVKAEARAMSLTDSAGGYLVPFQLDPTVILTNASAIHPIRQICRTVVATGDVWHGVSSAGSTFGFAAEYTEASDNSPTLAQPAINVHKAQGFVPISIEAIEDAANIDQVISDIFADGFFNLDAEKLVTGTGTNEPVGIVTALTGTASEINSAGETIAAADVYGLQSALPARWRMNAQWAGNIGAIHTIAQVNTSGVKEFPGVTEIESVLLGHRLWEVSKMDGTFDAGATGNNYMLIYGDWSQYVIADRIGMTVEFIPHLLGSNRRPNGSRGWYGYRRYGADVLVDDAFRMLDVVTTA